jgi:hypothetical protein
VSRAALGAAVLLVGLTGALAACSRPTAQPTAGVMEPGPFGTIPPVLEPGDEGYPPPAMPTLPLPEGYPGPDGAVTETMATEALTATTTVTP